MSKMLFLVPERSVLAQLTPRASDKHNMSLIYLLYNDIDIFTSSFSLTASVS